MIKILDERRDGKTFEALCDHHSCSESARFEAWRIMSIVLPKGWHGMWDSKKQYCPKHANEYRGKLRGIGVMWATGRCDCGTCKS